MSNESTAVSPEDSFGLCVICSHGIQDLYNGPQTSPLIGIYAGRNGRFKDRSLGAYSGLSAHAGLFHCSHLTWPGCVWYSPFFLVLVVGSSLGLVLWSHPLWLLTPSVSPPPLQKQSDLSWQQVEIQRVPGDNSVSGFRQLPGFVLPCENNHASSFFYEMIQNSIEREVGNTQHGTLRWPSRTRETNTCSQWTHGLWVRGGEHCVIWDEKMIPSNKQMKENIFLWLYEVLSPRWKS